MGSSQREELIDNVNDLKGSRLDHHPAARSRLEQHLDQSPSGSLKERSSAEDAASQKKPNARGDESFSSEQGRVSPLVHGRVSPPMRQPAQKQLTRQETSNSGRSGNTSLAAVSKLGSIWKKGTLKPRDQINLLAEKISQEQEAIKQEFSA